MSIKIPPKNQTHKTISVMFSMLNKLKVDADDSSNELWRSDQEDELIRLITSTPLIEAN